jgi:hypothetical protein
VLVALRRVPGQLWLGLVFAAIIVGGFVGTVVPLLTTGGAVRAEIAGQILDRVVMGQRVEQLLALDNTGSGVIRRTCLLVRLDPAGIVEVPQVTFQGLETVPVTAGQACGGELSGQEVISLRTQLVPLHPGTVQVSFVAGDRGRPIGPPLSRTVTVVSR